MKLEDQKYMASLYNTFLKSCVFDDTLCRWDSHSSTLRGILIHRWLVYCAEKDLSYGTELANLIDVLEVHFIIGSRYYCNADNQEVGRQIIIYKANNAGCLDKDYIAEKIYYEGDCMRI